MTRLERALKRTESNVEHASRDKRKRDALAEAKREEMKKRETGKGTWYMKDCASRAFMICFFSILNWHPFSRETKGSHRGQVQGSGQRRERRGPQGDRKATTQNLPEGEALETGRQRKRRGTTIRRKDARRRLPAIKTSKSGPVVAFISWINLDELLLYILAFFTFTLKS